jgi:hypothetical protein
MTFYLVNVNLPTKSSEQKILGKNLFFVGILPLTKRAGSGAVSGTVSQWYGYLDSDPYQKVTNPQHWLRGIKLLRCHKTVRNQNKGFSRVFCLLPLYLDIFIKLSVDY